MYYGFKCTNEAYNWEGSAGCWGVLAFAHDKAKHVTEIDFRISDSYTAGSLAACRVKEVRAVNKALTKEEAMGVVFGELCDAILRNRVKYNLVYRDSPRTKGRKSWWVEIRDFQDMPKNHLMFLLFGLRSSCTGAHHFHYDELRKRGIKSFRKMVIGCSMFCQQSGMTGLSGLVSVPSGGRMFLTSYTTLEDIKSFYRGSELRGPADESWSAKGGYTSGQSGRCVQLSGCRSVISPATGSKIALKKNNPQLVAQAFSRLDRFRGDPIALNELLNEQVAFLKSLK